jgi:hypothetical protein
MSCVEPPVALPHLPAVKLAEASQFHKLGHGHLLDGRQDLSLVQLWIALPVLTLPSRNARLVDRDFSRFFAVASGPVAGRQTTPASRRAWALPALARLLRTLRS